MRKVAHHDSDIARGECEGNMEAIPVPCAAAAHGISEAQTAQRLQATTIPSPCPVRDAENHVL